MKDLKTQTLKNQLISGIFIFCVTLALSTTEVKAQNLSIGPKVGISYSTGAGDDVPDNAESVSGLVGGVFFKASSEGFFAFQPEILFHQKGGRWEDNGASYELNTNYIQVPLLFKAQIPAGDVVYPFIYIGPYGAAALSNEETGQFLGITGQDEADVNNFDAGGVAGVGMDFQVNELFLGFDARYDLGLTNVYDADDDSDEPDIKNRSFSLMFSLGVNLN